MKKPKVLIAYKRDEIIENYVKEYCDYEFCIESDRAGILEKIKDCDGLMLGGRVSIDSELLDCAKNLKVVANTAVGYNNFNIEEMKKRNVAGTHTPDVLSDTVADLALALMLSAGRRICELDRFMRIGMWDKPVGEDLFGIDVNCKKLGIIGMGRIGETVAKRAALGFDMEVCYHNRHRNESAETKYRAKYLDFDELLKTSDYVLVMTPLTDSTYHMIGSREFSLMKKNAVFINIARGSVVDEAALIHALKSGIIGAAGLDVFECEPIKPDNELLKMDNVTVTPHIGSATKFTRDAMAMMAVKNLVDGAMGKRPENIILEMR